MAATREIWHQVRIKVPQEEVFAALTDADRLGRWWIPDTRGESRVGEKLEFWFSTEGCQEVAVTEVQPAERVRWLAQKRGLPDWVGTEVDFELQTTDRGTLLNLRHTGWSADAPLFAYSSWSWAVFLTSLKDYLETGEGFPLPNRWIGN